MTRERRRVSLRALVTGPTGQTVANRIQVVDLAPGDNTATVSLPLENIQRWDLDHPNLYHLGVEILDGDRLLDSASDHFGLRELVIRDRHLLINDQRVRLSGMTRHNDSPWEGLAESPGTLRHDWEDMKSLNMTLTRPIHYPPGTRTADFADRRGILLIPEIPIWQASEQQLSNPQYLALAKQQMRELIEQYGNHPSVFAWSVFNESAAGTPGGIRFFREMRDYIKALDPDRYVTLADDNLPKLERAEHSAANDADFLMMNQYFGAWHGRREALGPALDKVDRLFPTKMVVISELGFPGIFAKTPAEADPMRVSILREQMPLLAKRDWIAGAICGVTRITSRGAISGQARSRAISNTASSTRIDSASPRTSPGRRSTSRGSLELHWSGCERRGPGKVCGRVHAQFTGQPAVPSIERLSTARGSWWARRVAP